MKRDMKLQEFEITKIDVARRQIIDAVRLFFLLGDPLSVHTLAAAARNVLEDLARKRGNVTSHKDRVVQNLEGNDELAKIWHKAWTNPENFLKHADKDPEGSFIFKPKTTMIILYDACYLYNELTCEKLQAAGLFLAWFAIKFDLKSKLDDPVSLQLRDLSQGITAEDPEWKQFASSL